MKFFKTFFTLRTRLGKVRLSLLILVVAVFLGIIVSNKEVPQHEMTQVRSVKTAKVSSFLENSAVQFIGTVEATSRAQILSEVPGRVVSAPVVLGQTVTQGMVIATLENATQYAAVLQAEGLYDAAVASAAVADVSVEEAQLQLQTVQEKTSDAYKSAYITLSGLFYTNLDLIFADPTNTYRTPGAQLVKSASIINQIDTAFDSLTVIFDEWFTTSGENIQSLEYAKTAAVDLLTVIAEFQALLTDDELNDVYDVEAAAYLRTLNSTQSSVRSVLVALDAAQTNVNAAQEVLNKAQIGGTSSTLSVSNAQVKQALGALKSAQAQYNKTILRSPINGLLNSITIKKGDFVTSFQQIAEVANNDALEITAYVGQSDRQLITVQQEVMIEGSLPGVVTTIAPAVDSRTGKVEIRIQSASPELVNGDVVTFSLSRHATSSTSGVLQVPLTAVKFTAQDGFVFTVADGVLLKHAVTLGAVRDQYVRITQGIKAGTEVVVDVRGLNEGQKVKLVSE